METKDLKEIGFKIGSLKTITKDNLNVKQKIVYQKLPHYKESYVYAFLENLNTFYFGDKNDSVFFTLTVKSIQQIQDLIETVSDAPRLEMFARREREGWDVWGNEVESSVAL